MPTRLIEDHHAYSSSAMVFAKPSRNTVVRFENEKHDANEVTVMAIKQAFGAAGVRFEGRGVFPPEEALAEAEEQQEVEELAASMLAAKRDCVRARGMTTTADKLVEAFARHGVIFTGTLGVSFKDQASTAAAAAARPKKGESAGTKEASE